MVIFFSTENTALTCSECQVLCNLCLTRVDIASHVLPFALTLQKAVHMNYNYVVMLPIQLVKKSFGSHFESLHSQEQS